MGKNNFSEIDVSKKIWGVKFQGKNTLAKTLGENVFIHNCGEQKFLLKIKMVKNNFNKECWSKKFWPKSFRQKKSSVLISSRLNQANFEQNFF